MDELQIHNAEFHNTANNVLQVNLGNVELDIKHPVTDHCEAGVFQSQRMEGPAVSPVAAAARGLSSPPASVLTTNGLSGGMLSSSFTR